MAKVANIDALVAGQKHREAHGLEDQIVEVRTLCANSGCGLTKFATTLICLLDVTSQLSELDEAFRQAAQAVNQDDKETSKWREISMTTMKFAQSSLVGQQLRAIEVLQDLSSRGASIHKNPEGQTADASGACRLALTNLTLSASAGLSAFPVLSKPPPCPPESTTSVSRVQLLSMRPQVASAKPEASLKIMPVAGVAASWRSWAEIRQVSTSSKKVTAVRTTSAKLPLPASDESDAQDVCSTRSPSNCLISDAYDSE